MPKPIIADTSCFVILSKIEELDLLHKMYGGVTTTKIVAEEYGELLPHWVEIIAVKDKSRQLLLELQLDRGESSTIALALETPESTLILDDGKARKIAHQLGLAVSGTIGVIVKVKLQGIIPSIKPILDRIKGTNFRISVALEFQALQQAGELD